MIHQELVICSVPNGFCISRMIFKHVNILKSIYPDFVEKKEKKQSKIRKIPT